MVILEVYELRVSLGLQRKLMVVVVVLATTSQLAKNLNHHVMVMTLVVPRWASIIKDSLLDPGPLQHSKFFHTRSAYLSYSED